MDPIPKDPMTNEIPFHQSPLWNLEAYLKAQIKDYLTGVWVLPLPKNLYRKLVPIKDVTAFP